MTSELFRELVGSKFFTVSFTKKNGDLRTGKNRLIFEVANRFVVNFLAQEKKLLKDQEQCSMSKNYLVLLKNVNKN